MANGLSFKVLMQLQTKQFNQGINSVKKSLNSLKATFMGVAGALTGGLGLFQLVSSFKETATKLSALDATLKNVSNGFGEYADNMSFLKRISNTYGQDLMSLTDGFAKFRAAAKDTNLSLETQRDIYEALTQAAGAYHLSAQDTSNAMLAVSQMFSKGKVTAEELRRQLGNTLPGAFNMMAKAAGMAGITINGTTQELEDMMRAGKVATEDVMPAFAQVLKTTTQNANFDSLQSSLNRFKNSWVEFVDKSSFGDMFKKLVDTGNKALQKLTFYFDDFKAKALAVAAAIISGMSFKGLAKGAGRELEEIKKKILEDNVAIEASVKKVEELEAAYNKLYDTAANQKKGGFKMYIGEEDLKKAGLNPDNYVKVQQTINGIEKTMYRTKTAEEQMADIEAKIIAEKGKQAGLQQEINNLTNEGNKKLTITRTITLGLKNAFKAVGVAIKSAFNMIIFAAIISAITEIVTRIKDAIKFNQELKNQNEKVKQSVERIADATANQISKVETLEKYAKMNWQDEKKRMTFIEQINKELGLSGKQMLTNKSKADEVAEAIKNWKKNILETAKAAAYFSKIQELISKNIDLESENATLEPVSKETRTATVNEPGFQMNYEVSTRAARKAQQKIKQNLKQIEANNKSLEMLQNEVAKQGLNNPFEDQGGNNGNGSGGDAAGTVEDLKKAVDKYKQSIKELNNQKDNGALSNEEYFNELLKAEEQAWKTIASFDELQSKLKSLGGDYSQVVSDLKNDFNMNTMIAEIDENIKEVDKKLDKELDELIEKEQKYFNKVLEITSKPLPEKEKRNTFFDYKTQKSDQFGQQADINDKYVKSLEEYRDELLDLQKEYGKLDAYGQHALNSVCVLLKQAKTEASDMRDKAQIAEWIEDVEELKKAYGEDLVSAIEGGASAFGQLATGAHQMAEAFATLTDQELSEEAQNVFNKIDAGISIINTLIQTINTVTTVIEGIRDAKLALDAVEKASSSEEAINMAVKLGLLKAEEAEEKKSALVTVGAEKVKQAETEQTTGLLGMEAVAGAASSQSSIPIIGPILAGIAVAGIIALLATSMAKFAKGGIVGGNQTQGDNNVVRANSGEMILTKGQQGTLFNMLNGKGGIGGNVEFKIRGTDLIGAINNTNNKRKGI